MSEFKLGKLPAKPDKRTITLSSILREELLPPLPLYYDNQEVLNVDDDFMFANDQYGDCVKAARAHQTLVFEAYEQKKQILITDQEVVDEYFRETGGPDSGLVLLYSLKDWHNDGWIAGGEHYTIYAFASVDWKDHDQVKHCIHLLGGVNFGMKVYQNDMDQFNTNKPWRLTGDNGAYKGGHGVYLHVYGTDKTGIVCTTWGRQQRMSWEFWDARVDEAYGIVDNRNAWMATSSPVDVQKLDGYLKEITTNGQDPKPGCLFGPLSIIRDLIRR